MCGIVGYVGPRLSQAILLGGLRRLEYRGYDSAGVALIDAAGTLHARKRAGKLAVLRDDLQRHPLADGTTGIAHTRWATHGGPTDGNAHPHLADDDKLAVIHNGIIENFAELKQELLAEGVAFLSDTDTEVAAQLIAREYRATGSLEQAFRRVVRRLDGAFTLLAVHADEPGLVVGARLNSPLVVGVGDGEYFLGSDVAAFVEHTHRAIAIGQAQIVVVRADGVEITDFDGNPASGEPFEVSWDAAAAEKGGWSSFMAKEIDEEPLAVENTLRGRLSGRGPLSESVDGGRGPLSESVEGGRGPLGESVEGGRGPLGESVQGGREPSGEPSQGGDAVVLPDLDELGADYFAGIDRIIITAAGTASYAGLVATYAIEAWARIPATVELAHEFRYRDPIIDERTLVVSVSQSGETMDTLMAVRYARERGAKTLSICNSQGATIPRESDAVIYTHAGPEVAVASTKAFLAQITALYLLAIYLGEVRGALSAERSRELLADFRQIPDKLRQVLEVRPRIQELAHWMADTRSVLFLGRHVGYPIALEGALKLKELAYIHAEGFAAGELKHGPIALIEPGQPVFVIVPSPRHDNSLHPKVISAIQEIRARGARVLAIAEAGDAAVLPFADEVIGVPPTGRFFEPLLAVVPLQVFALELAAAKGLDVDQPRNLAKSVTVE